MEGNTKDSDNKDKDNSPKDNRKTCVGNLFVADLLKKRLQHNISKWILRNFKKHPFLWNTSGNCFLISSVPLDIVFYIILERFETVSFHEIRQFIHTEGPI